MEAFGQRCEPRLARGLELEVGELLALKETGVEL
jgi:hypothetical protein